MKIYEFENLLDNGITTFEFEITKDVNYFFNEKEIEDLIKRINRLHLKKKLRKLVTLLKMY